jgi:hypothetical protein
MNDGATANARQPVSYKAPKGPWVQEKEAFKGDNSGHGMLFRTFEGKLLFIIHHEEANGPRKPQIGSVDDSGDKLVLNDRYSF